MYPNLMGQKEYNRVSDAKMADLIHVSRQTYRLKVAEGRLSDDELETFARYFGVSREYIRTKITDIPKYQEAVNG